MGDKSERNSGFFIVSVVVIVALIIAFFSTYINNMASTFNQNSVTMLSEINTQCVNVLAKQIDGDLAALRTIASFVSGQRRSKDMDRENIISQLKEKANMMNLQFKRLGVIEKNGQAITTDDLTMELGDRYYFKAAMSGQARCTGMLEDRADGGNIVVYSVPIWQDGAVQAVLFATHRVETFQDIISFPIFSGEGYFYICDGEGNIVVESDYIRSVLKSGNIFTSGWEDGIDNDESRQQILKLKGDMSAGTDGVIRYGINGVERYMSYTKMAINDWYVMTVVPTATVLGQFSKFVQITIVACVAISAIFLLLLFIVVFQHRKSRKELRRLAFIDPVTGIGNINSFFEQLERRIPKSGSSYQMLFYFDIDQFKLVNDLYGFNEGDDILRKIARMLGERFPEAVYARISNDNFALALGCATPREVDVPMICAQICESLAEIKTSRDAPLALHPSIGVYCIPCQHKMDLSGCLDKALIAKKTVKGNSRCPFAIYDDTVRQKLLHEKMLSQELERGIENGEFIAYFQPKIELKSGRMVGAEALVRWNHPRLGLLAPGAFIPIFEQNNSISQLDAYMFEQVCYYLNAWKALRGFDHSTIAISVNISRKHLVEESFVEKYALIAERYGVRPDQIEIEITETAMMDNVPLLLRLIHALRDKGFLVGMDDFGSGYSSLNMLKDIPINVLKIDKAFFDENAKSHRSRVVVRNVVEMAKELSIQVVAEGVETAEQVALLREMDCDLVQGYYYAKPMNAQAFEELMREERIFG